MLKAMTLRITAHQCITARAFLLTGMASLALCACGVSQDEAKNAPAADVDPATSSALEDELLVDPDLVEAGNINNALDPSGPNSGAQPKAVGASTADSKAEAAGQVGGNGLLKAPEPVVTEDGDCFGCDGDRTGATLGAKADIDAGKRGKAACDGNLQYDAKWATRMPIGFKVYPRAIVKEAAGVDGGDCDIRAVTFTTKVDIKDVVDYYYTRARNNDYTAEYQLRDSEHSLGGTRESDDGAFVIFLRRLGNGLTEVDIVANNGR
jgi:hypothetical protein